MAAAPVDLKDVHFPPIQKRILSLLSDGIAHKRDELMGCMGDELAGIQSLNTQLTGMRKVLRVLGLNVVCVLLNRSIHYQLVWVFRKEQASA